MNEQLLQMLQKLCLSYGMLQSFQVNMSAGCVLILYCSIGSTMTALTSLNSPQPGGVQFSAELMREEEVLRLMMQSGDSWTTMPVNMYGLAPPALGGSGGGGGQRNIGNPSAGMGSWRNDM